MNKHQFILWLRDWLTVQSKTDWELNVIRNKLDEVLENGRR